MSQETIDFRKAEYAYIPLSKGQVMKLKISDFTMNTGGGWHTQPESWIELKSYNFYLIQNPQMQDIDLDAYDAMLRDHCEGLQKEPDSDPRYVTMAGLEDYATY